MKIAYLGPPGTYTHQVRIRHIFPLTHQAAIQEFGKSESSFIPQASIGACFDTLDSCTCDYAVVPFENSSNGQVVFTYDLLADWFVRNSPPSFNVVGEQFVSINHYLIGFEKDISKIETIYSHPQVWSQCSKFLREWESKNGKAERIDTSSTSRAVELVKERESVCVAAIASVTASQQHNVPLQSERIQDFESNTTRFLILGDDQHGLSKQKKSLKKISILAFILKKNDEHGSLCQVLDVLRKHGLNISSMTTRPSKLQSWRYIFFLEIWQELNEKILDEMDEYVVEKVVIGTFNRSERYWA